MKPLWEVVNFHWNEEVSHRNEQKSVGGKHRRSLYWRYRCQISTNIEDSCGTTKPFVLIQLFDWRDAKFSNFQVSKTLQLHWFACRRLSNILSRSLTSSPDRKWVRILHPILCYRKTLSYCDWMFIYYMDNIISPPSQAISCALRAFRSCTTTRLINPALESG